MRKTFNLIVLCIVTTVLTQGCTMFDAKNAATLVSDSPTLIASIEVVIDDITTIHEEKCIFTDNELERLTYSVESFEIARAEYSKLLEMESIPDIDKIEIMWSRARIAYIDALTIIGQYTDIYPINVKADVEVMSMYAERSDKAITELLANPNTDNVAAALKIADSLLAIGLIVAQVAI